MACCRATCSGSYSARKLGLKTTGNAGGIHNLIVSAPGKPPSFDALLKQMGTGLFVTELMGQGVNGVTGDYSRGASGFWVENGRDRLSGARDHHCRQPEADVPGHRGAGHGCRYAWGYSHRVGVAVRDDYRWGVKSRRSVSAGGASIEEGFRGTAVRPIPGASEKRPCIFTSLETPLRSSRR